MFQGFRLQEATEFHLIWPTFLWIMLCQKFPMLKTGQIFVLYKTFDKNFCKEFYNQTQTYHSSKYALSTKYYTWCCFVQSFQYGSRKSKTVFCTVSSQICEKHPNWLAKSHAYFNKCLKREILPLRFIYAIYQVTWLFNFGYFLKLLVKG